MTLEPQAIAMLVGIATLGTLVWKMGALASELTLTVRVLKEEVTDLKSMRAELQALPALQRDVEQLKDTHARTVSDVRELREEKAGREAVARWSQHGEDS